MKEQSLDELRKELGVLEARAAQLSAMRSHLHHQIDFGFESSTTRDREREISDERQEVHRRIDTVRELLRARALPAD